MVSPEKFGEGKNLLFQKKKKLTFMLSFISIKISSGIKKGSLSLIDGTIGGLFNTTALVSSPPHPPFTPNSPSSLLPLPPSFPSLPPFQLTGTLARGLSSTSSNKAYRKEQERNARERVSGAGEGVVYGMKALGTGVFEGVTGIGLDFFLVFVVLLFYFACYFFFLIFFFLIFFNSE